MPLTAGGVFELVVRDYVAGDHTPDGGSLQRNMLIGGTVLDYRFEGNLNLEFSRLSFSATDLLAARDAVGRGNAVPLYELLHGTSWTIIGRSGDDTFWWASPSGQFATDRLFGGNDTFDGRGGNDVMRLCGGNDKGIGGRGNDTIFGDEGRDQLFGDAGKDSLAGGDQNDLLKGGGGNDTLEGGKGNDRMFGGGGADHFSFNAGAGRDRILDFDPRRDTIRLDDEVSGERIVAYAQGVRVVHSEGRIDLVGLALNQIDEGDILGW